MTEPAPSHQIQDLSAAFTALVAKVAPGIVSVHSHRSRSSGFVWRPGLIVTADEALSEEGEFAVTLPGGDVVAAQLAGRDSTTDVALLRVDRADLQPVLLEASPVAAGALVMAVGAEDGTPTVAVGVVSRAAGPGDPCVAARSTPGSSLICACGGAPKGASRSMRPARRSAWRFLDRVGVCSSSHRPRSNASRRSLRATGASRAAIIGLGLQPVAIEGGDESGAMVMSVDPQGPGAAAGVYQGDIIVTWNSEPIRHVHSLLRALGPDSVGQTVTLRLRRAGETKQVPLTIAERHAA